LIGAVLNVKSSMSLAALVWRVGFSEISAFRRLPDTIYRLPPGILKSIVNRNACGPTRK
jgi:hypothetical protein